MREIDLTVKEFKDIIGTIGDGASKEIGSGNFGTTFLYKGKLIKTDKILYNILKINDPVFAEKNFRDHYRWGRPEFANVEQIRELASRRHDITLTKLPEGIVRVDGKATGIILPYHENHQALENLSPMEHEVLIEILKKLRLALMELANNKISQEDLSHYPDKWDKKLRYNILYQGNTPQIIDLEGENVKVGKDFTDAKAMYNELAFIILDYFRKNKLDTNINFRDINDEHQAKELIEEFEHRLRGK